MRIPIYNIVFECLQLNNLDPIIVGRCIIINNNLLFNIGIT